MTMEAAGRAGEEEVKAGIHAEAKVPNGTVKVTRSGNICVSRSPCTYLRSIYEKYKKMGYGLAEFEEQLANLEQRGHEAAAAVDRATLGNDGQALAKHLHEEHAVAKEAAVFVEKLDAFVAQKQSITAMLDRVAKVDPASARSLGGLSDVTLKNLAEAVAAAKLDETALVALSKLDPATLKKLEMARLVQNPTTKVGSSAPWTGKGTAPRWDNIEAAQYKHVLANHEQARLDPKNQHKIWDRVRTKGDAQGIWRDNQFILEAEKLAPPFEGQYIIDMGKDIGDVFEVDGTITKSVTKAFVLRRSDGTLRTTYPISGSFETYKGKISDE